MAFFSSEIVKGIIAGVIASGIYAFFMFCLSPRVDISKVMCYSTEKGVVVHRIKVINKSRARLINVNYSLNYITVGDDDIKKIEEVKQLEESYKHTDMDKYSRKDTDFAVRVKYVIDPKRYPLNEHSFFQFKITVMRSFSNTVKCFKRDYHINDIKQGRHEKGKNLGFICID